MINIETLRPRTGPVALIPIVLEDGLYLLDRGIFDRKTKIVLVTPSRIITKFVGGFRATWMQIPERDRDTLTGHWKSRYPSAPNYMRLPTIALSSTGLDCYRALCGRFGTELLFSVDFLDRAKRPTICHTIAHELGHALSHAHGWFQQHKCLAHLGECLACECRAHSYMAAWGFDPFEEDLPKVKGGFLVDRLTKARQRME